jgi:hypothetical protein
MCGSYERTKRRAHALVRVLQSFELSQLDQGDATLVACANRPATPDDEGESDAQCETVDQANPTNRR